MPGLWCGVCGYCPALINKAATLVALKMYLSRRTSILVVYYTRLRAGVWKAAGLLSAGDSLLTEYNGANCPIRKASKKANTKITVLLRLASAKIYGVSCISALPRLAQKDQCFAPQREGYQAEYGRKAR